MPQAPEGPRKRVKAKGKSPVAGKTLGPFPVPRKAVKRPVQGRTLGPFPVPKKAVKKKATKGVLGKKLGPYPVPKAGLKKVSPRHVNADPRGKPLKHAGPTAEAIEKAGVGLSPLGKKGVAPVLKAIDLSMRPLYAVMNAQKQTIDNQQLGGRDRSPLEAAKKGLQGKERTTGSDVLKQAGVRNKAVAGAGGLALDFAVTGAYPGLSGGSLAGNAVRNTGNAAAKRTLKKAAKQKATGVRAPSPKTPARKVRRDLAAREGLDAESRNKRMAEIAREQAEKGRPPKKGRYLEGGKPRPTDEPRGGWVGVGYGERGQVRLRVRTDRTAGGEARGRSKLATKVSDKVRAVVSPVRPTVRRSATDSPRERQQVLGALAEARAKSNEAYDRAIHQQEAIVARIPRSEFPRVVDAIERRKLGSLPDELRVVAGELRDNYRFQARLRRRSGLPFEVGGRPASKRITVEELPKVRSVQGKRGSARDVGAYLKMVERELERRPARGPRKGRMGYFAHMRESDIRKGAVTSDEEIFGRAVKTPSVTTAKKREVHEPISVQNPKLRGDKKYSTDISVVHPNTVIQTGRVEARARIAEGVREMGEQIPVRLVRTKKGKLKRSLTPVTVPKGKVVVHVGSPSRASGGGGPRVTPLRPDDVDALVAGKGFKGAFKGGQFRVIDSNTMAEIQDALEPFKHLKVIDRPSAAWKSVATATPTFQARNFVGDMERVYSLVPAREHPGLMRDAVRVLRFSRKNQFNIAGAAVRSPDDAFSLGRSGSTTVGAYAKELREQGIVHAGIRGQDIRSTGSMGRDVQLGDEVGRVGRINRALRDAMVSEYGNLPTRRFGEVLQTRENIPYVIAYTHFRRAGFGPAEARRRTMDRMIDYGELTRFEKGVARRVAPFYTFSARVVPAYAKTFVKNPGKVAAYGAVRDEVAKFFGVPPDTLDFESKFKQRGAGIPIKVGGDTYYVSYGLPMVQGLNELPFQLLDPDGVKEYGREVLRYGISILAPWWKAPLEAMPVAFGGPGFNYFFEAPVQNEYAPLVPAPAIPGLPWDSPDMKPIAKVLGIREFTNPRGVRQYGWEGWKQYLWNMPMVGTPGFAFRIGQEENQRGQTRAMSALSFATGAKIDRSDPISAAISNTYKYIDGLEKARSEIAVTRGKGAAYKALSARITAAKRQVYRLGQLRGDKDPPGLPPAKGRVKKVDSGPTLGGARGGVSVGPTLGGGSSTSTPGPTLGGD